MLCKNIAACVDEKAVEQKKEKALQSAKHCSLEGFFFSKTNKVHKLSDAGFRFIRWKAHKNYGGYLTVQKGISQLGWADFESDL